MIEGRPHILVIGAADTGRAPLLAAVLRSELGAGVSVASAGVLAHAGEPADPNIALALEQRGLQAPMHVARPFDAETARPADVLLAIDRGTARVVRLQTDKPVLALSELAEADDVPDPHRMPLGVWIAAMRAYETQLAAVLPIIRARLNMQERPAAVPPAGGATAQPSAPTPSTPEAQTERADHLQRIGRLVETARVLPEIVDWSKLTREAVERLQALAALAEDPDDLTPAAAALLAGLLLTAEATPAEPQLALLQNGLARLGARVDVEGHLELNRLVRQWWG